MGEVYKARDTRLDRTVAIKILPETLAADPQFRERFNREARAISQLDDPHICALYDVGEHEGMAYLVMQYLDGETLADRLARGPLPLDQALPIAVDIASALERAHAAGIAHRDLKPGNIMLTRGGAKLLDFGLAKPAPVPLDSTLSVLPTTPPNLTTQGTILGTWQYMAPEQLEGKDADARTDVFAFGAVLYEALTGRKAFSGASHASLITSIMSSHPPPLSQAQSLAPAELDHLIARCLAKNPEERWQSTRDLKAQLSWMAEAPRSLSLPATKTRSRDLFRWLLGGVVLIAVIGAVAAIVTARRAPETRGEPVQFVILPPEKASFSGDLDAQAVSPDGRQIVFAASEADGTPHLWIRRLDSLNARMLAGSDDAFLPFWSPDSRSVGFFAGGKLKTIDVGGGPPQTLADAPFPLGGTWNRDGAILFGKMLGSPIYRVSAEGGAATPVTNVRQTGEASSHGNPSFLPDGRHFLFLAFIGPTTGSVYVGSLDSSDVKLLLRSNSAAVFSPPGYVLYLRDATLIAQSFDVGTLSTRGRAASVADGVGRLFMDRSFTASDNGVLLYRPGVSEQSRLTWVNRAGQTQGVGAPTGVYREMALSPDERRVAFSRAGDAGLDVWLTDLDRRITSRFTFRPPVNNVPIWSPDGRQIVFASAREKMLDLYRRASDASAPDELLLRLNSQPILFPSDWSADGRLLTYYRSDPKTQLDIWTLPLSTGPSSHGSGRPDTGEAREPVPFLKTEFNESQGQFSPDGRWMAYVSDESGRQQVYVQSFPRPGAPRQISTEGGTQPRWRRDGQELFYLASDRRLMAVPVRAGTTFEADAPRALFQTELYVGALRQSYAVSRDGQRFLLNTPVVEKSSSLTVIVNWPALLKN